MVYLDLWHVSLIMRKQHVNCAPAAARFGCRILMHDMVSALALQLPLPESSLVHPNINIVTRANTPLECKLGEIFGLNWQSYPEVNRISVLFITFCQFWTYFILVFNSLTLCMFSHIIAHTGLLGRFFVILLNFSLDSLLFSPLNGKSFRVFINVQMRVVHTFW